MSPTLGFIVLLVLAGLVLMLFELLTISFGILTGLSIISFAAAIYLAFTISVAAGIWMIIVLAIGVPVYLVAMIRWLPKTSIGKKLFLEKAQKDSGAAAPDAAALDGLIGREALAETMLRPGGMIRIEGRRVDAQAESGVIDAGKKVRIVGISMGNAVVRQVE